MLLTLQADYADWLAAMPESLRESPTAQALENVSDPDIAALGDFDLQRGFGRD